MNAQYKCIDGLIFTKKRYASQVNMMFGLVSKQGEGAKHSTLNTGQFKRIENKCYIYTDDIKHRNLSHTLLQDPILLLNGKMPHAMHEKGEGMKSV